MAHEAAPRDLPSATAHAGRRIKCVVWDLDNTLWDGILLEDREVVLRERVVEAIKVLDARGIVHSIASKNEHAPAIARLRDLGLAEYFLHAQINWGSKVGSLQSIAQALGFGLDALAFVDDEPAELAEVAFSLPEVLCLSASDIDQLLGRPDLDPPVVTEDARARRLMYLADARRSRNESAFGGSREEFLATLGMTFSIRAAREEDLQRAEELTLRTNQLNATGYAFSSEQLDGFRQSEQHDLLIAGLEDRYGSYGKVGLALVERPADTWTIKLLLMSCRVITRGVGAIVLGHIIRRARAARVRLLAEFVDNGRNRMLYVTYRFAGFREIERTGARALLEADLTLDRPFPDYVSVLVQE